MMKKILLCMGPLMLLTACGHSGSNNSSDSAEIPDSRAIYLEEVSDDTLPDVDVSGLPMLKDRPEELSSSQVYSDERIQEASFQIVKSAVKSQLTNPSTADFSLMSVNREKFGKHTYRYKGTLTAKNAYGAEEKLRYLVTLTYFEGDPMDPSGWSVTTCEVKPDL